MQSLSTLAGTEMPRQYHKFAALLDAGEKAFRLQARLHADASKKEVRGLRCFMITESDFESLMVANGV